MLKKLFSIILVFTINSFLLTTPSHALNNNYINVESNKSTKFTVVSTNSLNINSTKISVPIKTEIVSESEFSESCDCIIMVDENNNIEVVDSLPIMPRATQETSDETVYWKAKIKITYTKSGDIVNLTKVEGSWYQLRGTSTIVYRNITYGQVFFVNNNDSGSKYPTTNTFSYNTGFSAGRIIPDKSYIGACSYMQYTRNSSTNKATLEVYCDKYF